MVKNAKVRVLEIGVGAPGGGPERWPGAEMVRVDVAAEAEPDVVADPRALPEDLGEFDVILASHVLQCVPRTEILETLRHWATFLKVRGELHLIVPDLGWAADEIGQSRSVDKMTLGVIYGTQHAPWAFHQTGFTADLLRTAVYAVGLEARAARLGPYKITAQQPDGTRREVVARQIYVVAVKVESRE